MPTTIRHLSFRVRNGIKAFTALLLATVLLVSGLEYQANALTVSNGNCSANVNVTTSVSVFAEGNYCYVAFKSTTSYQWTPPAGVSSIDLLVVAGGGGGGTRHGGGGGAGGLLSSQSVAINGSSMSITVGSGGAGAVASAWSGTGYPDPAAGQNSVVSGGGIATRTAIGGGQGTSDGASGNGGSGGGGSCCSIQLGTGTSGQGFDGSMGTFVEGAFYAGGAGGGAGGAATSPISGTQTGARAGIGAVVTWVTSTAAAVGALAVGDISSTSVYFASGGGGGTDRGTAAAAQPGGGSAGTAVLNTDVIDGKANTGGGGGGSGLNSGGGSPAGGDGGSGVVVLRYLSVAGTLTDGDCSASLDNTTSASIASVTDYCVITLSGATTYSWTRPAAVTSVDVLVVGGGGGGGGGGYLPAANGGFGGGGSGGGGGQATASTLSVSSSSYTISVGAGGTAGQPASGGAWGGAHGGTGTASSGFGITAAGGGQGYGASANDSDFRGWSDGLAAWVGGTSGSGNAGGARGTTGAGGGGGQGSVGTAGSGINGSSGGTGLSSSLTGTAAFYGAGGAGGAGGNIGAVAATAATGFGAGGSGGRGGHDGTRLQAAGTAGTTGAVIIRYAKFHTVTYNYDGATSGNSTASAVYTRLSAGLTLPTPTKTGYFFKGWYSDASKTQFVGVGGASYSTTSATTLYAAWSNLVVNLDASNQTSLGITNPTTWNSIFPASSSAVGNISGATYSNVNNVKSLALGSGKYVSFPAGTGSVPGAITVESWINPSTLSDSMWNIIATRWFTQPDGTGGVQDWHFAIKKTAQNTYKLNLYTTSSSDVYGTTTFSSTGEDKWFQVGFTISSSNQLQFFVNGVADGTAVSGVSHTQNANARLYIGDGRAAMTMAGKMSKFRLYNEALSLPDLQNNFVSEASYFGYTPITTTFNANDGSGSPATSTQSAFSATNFLLQANAFTRSGLIFTGWNTAADGSGTSYTNQQTVALNLSTTLYAQWAGNSYTVTYNYNGATGANSTVSDSFTVGGSAITLPTPTKTGYTFGGWFEASALTGSALASTYSPSSTRTIYAKWTADTNTVTFNNNGGSGSMSNQSITSGVLTALTANSMTKTGYSFAGWATSAGGSVVYADSEAVTLTAGLTLYAKWSAVTNTVTFNANDGSGSPATSTQSIVSGSSTALTTNSFTRTGHSFAGWNTAANGSGTAYANSASVTILSNITLYAQWTAVTYTVTYNKNGASGNAERASESYTFGSTAITLPIIGSMTKTGYTFDGWSETNGGSKISGTYTPSASITLYARWVAASFSITYNDNAATSGSPSSTLGSYTTGGTAITLATQSTMARTGYTFAGWSTTINDSTTRINNSGSYTITAPVILYALWTAVDYSVTYSTQGFTSGAAPTDATVFHIGDTAVVKANTGALVKTGYTFSGWTVASDGSGTVLTSGDTVAIASSNVTLYPKWTANTYTVTFNVNGASGAPAGYSSGSSPFTESYTSGTTGLTLPAVGTLVKTGYDFAGWSTTPSGGVITNTGFTTSRDKTLYAVWNLKSINYTYARGVANGNAVTGSNITNFPNPFSLTGLYGSVINLSTAISPTAVFGSESYQFMGWNDGYSTYASNDAFTVGETASTFTATWVRLYEVRYALNGGGGIIDTDPDCAQGNNTCLANQVIHLSDAPTRAGYSFTGWKDQSNNSFAAGASTTVTDTSFLYFAQWQAINYTMAFNAQGGSTTPAQLTKNISDTFTLPSPGTKTGYTFSGWFDGTNTYGVGANYTVGTASKTFAALWTADVYTVTYNWNGGTGTAVPDVNYTYGSAAITLPTGSTHTRDGYTFAGWATSQGGSAISGGFTPSADTLLYARWVDGSYTVTLNAHGGALSQSSYSVSRGSSITLPAPTRTGFTFDGWYEDSATTLVSGQANTSFTPTATATLHAKWVQNSLSGVNPAHINSLTSITVTGAHTWSGTHSASGTGAALSIPNGALPTGTVVKVSFIEDLTRPRNIIDSSYAYYSSVIVHWLTGTGDSATVPTTAANKPLTLTMTNPAILPGARVFMIINGVATEAAEATQAGQVTIEITQDPEFVIAATKPSLPTSVTATAVSGSQATVSWSAPASTGGAPITGYTATASPGGASCSTTTALTCDITGLSSGMTYSYSVVADNAIGSSGVRSTTVTYVPPAPTPTAPTNTVPSAEVSPTLTLARTATDVAAVDVLTEPVVPVVEAEEPTDQPTSNPVAERIRNGDTGMAAYVIGLGVAGGLLALVLVGLLVLLARRRIQK